MADPTAVNSQITDAVAPEAAASQRPIGRFVWHDLMTTHPDKARQYYSDLLGWTYKDFTTPEGTYQMIHAAGTEWGGFMPLDPAHGVPSHWISYVTVADVDATTAKVQALGGQVAVPAMDIPTVGRFAVVASPTGAYVSPFRPELPRGAAAQPGAGAGHVRLARAAVQGPEGRREVLLRDLRLADRGGADGGDGVLLPFQAARHGPGRGGHDAEAAGRGRALRHGFPTSRWRAPTPQPSAPRSSAARSGSSRPTSRTWGGSR